MTPEHTESAPNDLEKRAIRALQRLARIWPEDLWIYAEGGSLHVMRLTAEGERGITGSGGVDPEYIVESVVIPSDGGGW